MATDVRAPETKIVFAGESALIYCASFEASPAVAGGATLSNPTVTADNGRVTIGPSPSINSQNFIEYDADGNVGDMVPAGKGVIFTLTPVSKGQATVTVTAQASDGSKPGKQVIFQVK